MEITASTGTVSGNSSTHAAEFSEALKRLTEAIVNSQQLQDQQKQEALDALALVGQQAEKPEHERQNGILKPVLESIPKVLSSASALTTLWHTFGSSLSAFFGF